MRGIIRYSTNGEMHRHGIGDFVLYNHHEVEMKRRDAEIARLRAEVEENEKVINVWRGRTQRAEDEVEAYRKDAEPVDMRMNSMYAANLHTIECFVEIARELRSRAEPYLEGIDEGGCASQDECSVHFDRMFHCVEIALQNIRPTYCDPMESERAAFEIYRVHSLDRDEYGRYENTVTADDWAMWQAACRHMKNKGK